MGCGQGGGGFFNQAEAAGAEGTGTGAALGLDQVGAGVHQINRELLLLVEGQNMGHGHRQHHLGEEGAGAAGELEHLGGIKEAPEGIEGVVVADLDQGGAGGHGGGEQLGIHRRHADRQAGHGSGTAYQLGITGQIDQVGASETGSAADALHRGGIKIGEAGDHLEQAPRGQGLLQLKRQAGQTGHGRPDSE